MRPALPALFALITLTLTACAPADDTGADMGPGRCDAWCDQRATCDIEPRAACQQRCEAIADACLTCGANSTCANLRAGACADECGERDAGVDDIGDRCAVNTECSTGWCRLAPGAPEPTCARNDLGEPCTAPADCVHDTCLMTAGEGTCTAPCEDFADCPSFFACGDANFCRRNE